MICGWFIYDLIVERILLLVIIRIKGAIGKDAVPVFMVFNDFVNISCSTIMLGYAINLLIEQKNNIGSIDRNMAIISVFYLGVGVFLRQYSLHSREQYKNNRKETNFYDSNGNCIYDGSRVLFYNKRYRVGQVLDSVPAYGMRPERIWKLLPDWSDLNGKAIKLEDAVQDVDGNLTIIEGA